MSDVDRLARLLGTMGDDFARGLRLHRDIASDAALAWDARDELRRLHDDNASLRARLDRAEAILAEPAPGWLDLHAWRDRLRAALDSDAAAGEDGSDG